MPRRKKPCLTGRHAGVLAVTLLLAAAGNAQASSWSEVTAPTPGPARAIGSYTAGCIAGAVALPPDGAGYEVVRMSRRRYFGHPDTVAFVERLGRRAAAAGLQPFYVGDMAQPRGGPLPYGHDSHQIGLDVDIWLNLDPKPRLPPAAREDPVLPSMVRPDGKAIDPRHFGARQVTLLRLAATDPAVNRLFVNWTIKRALCDGVGGAGRGDRSWLHRVRPWYGHEGHFHVRLNCPASSPGCVAQKPIPPGLGCDATLAWWARQPIPHPPLPGTVPPRREPRLPHQCYALLQQK